MPSTDAMEARTPERPSRSTTRGRSGGVPPEPSRSRSRPRTTVADALAGRTPVSVGIPTARSRTAGGSGGGDLSGESGDFVLSVKRHGGQPSSDWHAISLVKGGLDSAAGSGRSVGDANAEKDGYDDKSDSGRTENSDLSTESAGAKTTSTSKSPKVRWRCECIEQ